MKRWLLTDPAAPWVAGGVVYCVGTLLAWLAMAVWGGR